MKPTVATKTVQGKAEAASTKEHGKESIEEMEVAQVATQLSKQLHIEDIDCIDADNPQLCTEYAKEIYVYMRELEVRISPCALHNLYGTQKKEFTRICTHANNRKSTMFHQPICNNSPTSIPA